MGDLIKIKLRGDRLDPAEKLQAQIEGVCEPSRSDDPPVAVAPPGFAGNVGATPNNNNIQSGVHALTDDFKVYGGSPEPGSASPASQRSGHKAPLHPKKLSKHDIGAPHNFRHIQHGVNPAEAMFGEDVASELGGFFAGAGGPGTDGEPIYRDGPPPFLGDMDPTGGHVYESWPGPSSMADGRRNDNGDNGRTLNAVTGNSDFRQEPSAGAPTKAPGTAAGAAQFLQELMARNGSPTSGLLQSPEPPRPVSNYEFDTVAVSPSEVIYTPDGGQNRQTNARTGKKGARSDSGMILNAAGVDQLYAQVQKPRASAGAARPALEIPKSGRPSDSAGEPNTSHPAEHQQNGKHHEQPAGRSAAGTSAVVPAVQSARRTAVLAAAAQLPRAGPSVWFHQGLERAKIKRFAQQLSSTGEVGHFFVRDGVKSETGSFAMSAKFPDGAIKNFLIRPTNDGWYRIRGHDLAFPSIPALVLYYVEQLRPELGVQLRFPSAQPQVYASTAASQEKKLELLAMKVADKLREGPDRRDKLEILTDRCASSCARKLRGSNPLSCPLTNPCSVTEAICVTRQPAAAAHRVCPRVAARLQQSSKSQPTTPKGHPHAKPSSSAVPRVSHSPQMRQRSDLAVAELRLEQEITNTS